MQADSNSYQRFCHFEEITPRLKVRTGFPWRPACLPLCGCVLTFHNRRTPHTSGFAGTTYLFSDTVEDPFISKIYVFILCKINTANFLGSISALRTRVSGTPKPAMSRVPTPPPPGEMSSGPVAESWCYTQVRASWNSVYDVHCMKVIELIMFVIQIRF